MKTLRFFRTMLMAVLAASLVACSESSDSEEQPGGSSVPVDPGDYQDVPVTGGIIKKGNIAINFPSGTFDSDTKVAITEVKKGSVGGVCEASPFYQLTLPMSTKKPIAVKIKADNSSEDAEFVIRSPGYAVSLVSDVTNEATAETTYSNGVYTTTIPAFDNSNGKDNVSIAIGLCKLPDDNAARRTTRANHSVIGKDGNITWELDIDYWSKYSLDYKKLEAKLPTVNLYIKEAIRTIHSLGFKLPDGVKLNYHLADTHSWIFGDSWGYYSRSWICRSRDGIWLKDELVLYEAEENTQVLKQTIIHETLHNFQSYYLPSALPNPIGNYNAMFEMGAVWIEKFMNGGEPNGSWQMNEAGLHNTFKYHFRFGLSRESIDIMNLFIGLSPFAEYGYALGPLLHYMVSKKYPRGYDDMVVESLYSSYWGRIAQSDATALDVLDEWFNTTYVKTDEEFFNGTDNINEYYLALWKGEVMKDFSLTRLQQGMKEAKLNIDLLNENNSKMSLNGMVYPYGCEGMVFKMDKTCFKDSVLKDNEMVVKQEAEGLKTYLLYTNGKTIIQHPKAATKGDSITVSGEELEALRKDGAFNSTFFLLTVRTTGDLIDRSTIPSKESVEIHKATSTPKKDDKDDFYLYAKLDVYLDCTINALSVKGDYIKTGWTVRFGGEVSNSTEEIQSTKDDKGMHLSQTRTYIGDDSEFENTLSFSISGLENHSTGGANISNVKCYYRNKNKKTDTEVVCEIEIGGGFEYDGTDIINCSGYEVKGENIKPSVLKFKETVNGKVTKEFYKLNPKDDNSVYMAIIYRKNQ